MARRVLESPRGVGEVYAGQVLLREASYALSVWVEDDASPAQPSHVDGHIDITGISEAVVLAGPGRRSHTGSACSGRHRSDHRASSARARSATSWHKDPTTP